jgi:hypothetical protein
MLRVLQELTTNAIRPGGFIFLPTLIPVRGGTARLIDLIREKSGRDYRAASPAPERATPRMLPRIFSSSGFGK